MRIGLFLLRVAAYLINSSPQPLSPLHSLMEIPTRLDPYAYPETPANLTLEQVHVYVRHGERTPVGVRMNNPPANIPEHWLLCQAGRKFSAAVWEVPLHKHAPYSVGSVDIERVVEFRNRNATLGVCMLGELTDMGRESTQHFGSALRQLYIDRLGLLPDFCTEPSPVYYRSTNVPRTIESLQQIINGLYPNGKRNHRPHLLVRGSCHLMGVLKIACILFSILNSKDENIIPNHFSCKRLERMSLAFSQAAAETLNPTLKPLDKRISRYIDGEPIRIDGKPRASGILDTIRAAKAHGFKIPREFHDPDVMDLIEYAVVIEWFGGYRNHDYRRLATGPLFDDLQRKMQKKVDLGDKDPLKLLVYSTHDTAIAGIAASLDVFDQKWPEFTASVTFELFKEKRPEVLRSSFLGLNLNWNAFSKGAEQQKGTQTSQYYVRMRYQNKDMKLPICAEEGKHLPGSPEFCTLKAFQAYIKELMPEDWDEECIPPKAATTL